MSIIDVGCVFCGIVADTIPARKVYETKHSLVFLDVQPLTPGHTLAIPKAHHRRLQDMTPDECADLFEAVRSVAGRADKLTGATLVAVHNGEQSGQEVPHVHVHIIPRSKSDGAGPVHSMFSGAKPVDGTQTDAAYAQLVK